MSIRLVCGIGLFAILNVAGVPAFAQETPTYVTGRTFVQTIVEDLKSVASKESVPLVSVATAVALFASPFDETLTHSASCSTFLKTTFDGWARAGGQEWLLATSALATYAVGRTMHRPRAAAVGGDLIEAEVIAGLTTATLKFAVQRTRPDGEPRSFPSGHSSGTFAMATVVQRHFGWRGAVPAYTAAVLISGARLQANSHFASDVVIGAAVGILSGRAATFDAGRRRVQLSPGVVAGGFAINGTIH